MDKIDFPVLTDRQVRDATGKTWREWCELLNAWGGKTEHLTAVVQYLVEQHHLRRLWAQMIAVYYKWDWCG